MVLLKFLSDSVYSVLMPLVSGTSTASSAMLMSARVLLLEVTLMHINVTERN
jgi:hypothetical protein